MANGTKNEDGRDILKLIHKRLREVPVLSRSIRDQNNKQTQPDHGIQRLVFSGGGAKGVVYPGSYRALQETGVLEGIKEISGSSAGAIVGTLIAFGMPVEQFRELLLATNFKDLMGTSIGSFAKTIRLGMRNEAGITFFTKDGAGILALVRENVANSIRNFITKNASEFMEKQDEDDELCQLVNKIKAEQVSITFADLEVLNQYWPNHFRKLIIPAVRHPDGKVQLFSAERTPNVEIALACQASAAIPVLLKPVEIDLHDGYGPQKFVDAGIYDNVPSDYFDTDKNGDFVLNRQPEQTLVFAFGEGFDNQKNCVHQALYGSRWDEVLNEAFLSEIYENASRILFRNLDENNPLKLDNLEELFTSALSQVLVLFIKTAETVEESSLYNRMAHLIKKASASMLADVKSNPEKYPKLLTPVTSNSSILEIKALGIYLKEALRPIIYKAGFIDNLNRNKLTSLLGDLNPDYKSSEQKEVGYQKIRNQYPLRTVELRVGNIKTTDFKMATRHARIMDALGYLDTINYLTNHELHNPDSFNADQFYIDLSHHFTTIYKAILTNTHKKLVSNPLLNEIHLLKKQLKNKDAAIISRQICQLIKDHAETKIDSATAFALSQAVEYKSGILTSEALHEEVAHYGLSPNNTPEKRGFYG